MATEQTAVDYLTRSVDRNRYFYGKLMTVRDFLREQEYFNNKRWLINRLLFGSGIVCGLEVAAAGGGPDATVVEIQPGVAFDPLGREVTVAEPARVDLAKVVPAGLAPAGTAKLDLLVCLKYQECPKEPVPSLGGSPCAEACESNRIGETYTVTLAPAPPKGKPPTTCDNWLNRQTVRRPPKGEPLGETDEYVVERVAPVWVRPGEVFEVALKVTALKEKKNVSLSEAVVNGTLIEPNPQTPPQFPTTPVSLRKGEFFIYVYQVQAPAAPGKVQLSGVAGVPTPPFEVEVIDPQAADARETRMRLGACPPQPPPEAVFVPVARVTASFVAGDLEGVVLAKDFGPERFHYSLTRVAELLDCVRASLRAETESPRPGHLFITFKDVEQDQLKPVGPTADHGKSWTVPRGDHVHALLLYTDSGLKFEGNELRIEGNVGGQKINFLNTVSGQEPTDPRHLTTKNYVDSRIAGLDWQESVLDKDLKTPPPPPPTSPTPPPPPRYLLFAKPDAGTAWEGHQGSIATWNRKEKVWDFTDPDEGTAVFVDDENIAYLHVEGKWIPFLATPDVAAGPGLFAEGAKLGVGQGPGLKVNPNDVEVVFDANQPQPVGEVSSAGSLAAASRGDHTHELPLARYGGLDFGRVIGTDAESELPEGEKPDLRGGLFINGVVGSASIDFRHPVLGQAPTEPRHLATKQYVDGVAAGLDWQNSVLSKELTGPPDRVEPGERYLVIHVKDYFPIFTHRVEATEGPGETLSERERAELEEKAREEAGGVRPPPDTDTVPPREPDIDIVPFPFPQNPWSDRENNIATWDGRAWSFVAPNEGVAVFVEDENTAYLFVDGRWTPFMAMPEVAAGAGLFADGARLSVGQGSGLIVGENSVDVAYHAAEPVPVGRASFRGAAGGLSRGDHTHELPLAFSGGLEFVPAFKVEDGQLEEGRAEETVVEGEDRVPAGPLRLRVNGRINGDAIEFIYPVVGAEPTDARHLTTKQYVDGLVAGLTWQSTVLDKDETKPPDSPKRGDRYLLFAKPAADTPWEGRQNSIATWTGRRWDFTAPNEGMAAFVADENLAYLYADGKWVQFIAPPSPVGAGNGLVNQGTDLAVGQGEGLVVTPDAVSVNFGPVQPLPVGPSSLPGASNAAARGDHTHELPLAPNGGLVYSKEIDEERGRVIVGLKLDGPVSGANVNFLRPVAGQTPIEPRHLATKEYVDSKGGGTVAAGDGLVNNANGLSVVAGPGLVVNPDEVHVNFESATAQPVGPFSSPGASNTVARGDHTHAMPDVWNQSVATGVVAFDMRQAGKQAHVRSFAIDPGLGTGSIGVVVGLESEVAGEGTFVGEIDHFEDAMAEGGGFRPFQSVLLGAVILPPGFAREPVARDVKSTTFEIWAQATERVGALPANFRVRWWAYRAGNDQGVIDYVPPSPFDSGDAFDR